MLAMIWEYFKPLKKELKDIYKYQMYRRPGYTALFFDCLAALGFIVCLIYINGKNLNGTTVQMKGWAWLAFIGAMSALFVAEHLMSWRKRHVFNSK